MKKALKLAAKGLFTTGANPRVGCVIVKDDRIIAQAYHKRVGEQHAEVLALAKLKDNSAEGSTVYVTLEPCSHYGKNPPCAMALIKAKVKTVVVCNDDPNPLVAGKGYAMLKQSGIKVVTGVLAKKGMDLNRGFLHRMKTGLPWVRCKMAQSLDGRTAMSSGESYWITGESSRADVQFWRGRSGAIITGIETVLMDDCRMTVRPDSFSKINKKIPHDFDRHQPLKVVVDSQLRIPLDAKILHKPEQVLIVTAVNDVGKINKLKAKGVRVKTVKNKSGAVDLTRLIEYLGQQQINQVLVESGATLAGSLMQLGLIDELLVYTAPVIMGSSARPLLKINIEEMSQRLHIKTISLKSIGKDWRLRALVIK